VTRRDGASARRDVNRRDAWMAAALAALFALGIVRAVQLAWVCDDSFISLRYAENLVAGHGLVYNPGERVEGYTTLLWTLLLAALLRLGVDPIRAAELPGIAASAGLAALLAWESWRRSRAPGRAFLPLAAGLVLVCDDFHVWATGGLETALFGLLVAAALLATRDAPESPARPWLAGVLLALALLTRPDGVLFALVGVASWWLPFDRLPRRERLRAARVMLLPVVVVLALLVAWKLAYYGELLPTAFHSKSATRPYLAQGLVYLGVYLAKNWFLLAAGAGALVAWGRGQRALPRAVRGYERFLLLGAGTFVASVVWVGGDFMAARRLLPAVPLVFLALEEGLARWREPARAALAASAMLVAAALPAPIFEQVARINHIGEERLFYPREAIEARRMQALAVRAALDATGARVAFEGGMCVFGYYSRLPYLVELTGLTQYSLAKRPLRERGPIGHEKTADDGWLRENRIHLIIGQEFPPVAKHAPRRHDELVFGDLARARILLYEDAVMDPLRNRPDVHFAPIERVLEAAAREMEAADAERAAEILAGLEAWYFEHAGPEGEERARPLREILARKQDR
jgi:hypothetical protein